MVIHWQISLLWFVILLAACAGGNTPLPPDIVECPVPPPVEVLTDGWLFKTDPNDIGLGEAWYDPATSRANWTNQSIGRPWEQDGIAYDGIAWFTRPITWEQSPAYLFLADADDSAIVWINGVEAARLDTATPATVLTLDSPDRRAEVTVRVDDIGGYGGIKSLPRLATTYESAFDEARLIAHWESQQPDIPPAPRGKAWTMTGGVDQANEALIGREGFINPYAAAPAVQIWLHNSATGQTINPLTEGQFTLLNAAPIIQLTHEAIDGVLSQATVFYDETDNALRWQIQIESSRESAFDEVIIAVRPYRVNRTLTSFCNPVSPDQRHVWVNNEPFLVAGAAAEQFSQNEHWVGLHYRLEPGETVLDLALPAAAGADFPPMNVSFAERLANTQQAWRDRTEQADITLPDSTVQAALQASLGYLLLASDPNGPHPGPLAHNAVWTRDAAYMGLALLMRGHEDIARQYVDAVFSGQDTEGRVPPIQGESIPWDNNEWDAQGQAIYLAMLVYRYTGDEAYLREVAYPQMARAADYLIALREQTADNPNPAIRGLLPPSLSAEDLADGEQHYYWDNFWALVGLAEAAAAADILGTTDGPRWRAESDALRQAIEASVTTLLGDPIPYIPASVETLDNPGMARGTTPALHPSPVYSPNDPLLQQAFNLYAERFILPHNGGYLHREGQFWTYGGIELANVYLRLGRGDLVHQILGWTLNHQTLPGTFAWAEQVSPQDYSFTGGDMPHAWMAASMTILIRNMLVLEYALGPDDSSLTLFQTAPVWWFEDGRQISAQALPTLFGKLDLSTSSTISNTSGRWAGQLQLQLGGATPPGGFRWQLPHIPIDIQSDTGAYLDGEWLYIPKAGTITLIFE